LAQRLTYELVDILSTALAA